VLATTDQKLKLPRLFDHACFIGHSLLIESSTEASTASDLTRSFLSAKTVGDKMALSDASSPDERTPLLHGDTPNLCESLLGDAIKPVGSGDIQDDDSKSRAEDGGNVDEETGDVAVENALYDGNEEMRRKLYILCPAVGIGVAFPLLLLLPLLSPFSFSPFSFSPSPLSTHWTLMLRSKCRDVLISLKVFLIAMDQTLIVSSYARIGTELNALNNTSWIATALVSPFQMFDSCR
jgi:hypothetical protein